ncbi:MAG: protein kinase, partial [Rickettsiales bacterium]|nr:protein kinase [Rickettsiales bacterium]
MCPGLIDIAMEALNNSVLYTGKTFGAEDFKFIGGGSEGTLFAVNSDQKRLIVKVLKGEPRKDSGEAIYQEFCSGMGDRLSPYLVPTLYAKGSAVIMEYFDGKDLEKISGSADEEEQKALRSDMEKAPLGLLEGLKNLHDNGIAHRDIKPANLMCNKKGEMAIIDFGSAAKTSLNDLDEPAMRGTPEYFSPESHTSGILYSYKKRDIWALGLTILEVLSGKGPVMQRFVKSIRSNYNKGISEMLLHTLVMQDLLGVSPDTGKRQAFIDFINEEINSLNPPLANTLLWQELLLGMLNPDCSQRFGVDQAIGVAKKMIAPPQIQFNQGYSTPQAPPWPQNQQRNQPQTSPQYYTQQQGYPQNFGYPNFPSQQQGMISQQRAQYS